MSGSCTKAPEINGTWRQYSGRKFFGHFPDDFRQVPTGKNRNSPEENSKLFRREHCFNVSLISGVFLWEPTRILRPGKFHETILREDNMCCMDYFMSSLYRWSIKRKHQASKVFRTIGKSCCSSEEGTKS